MADPVDDTGAVIVTHDRADAAGACVRAASRDVDVSQIVVVVNHPEGASATDLVELRRLVPRVVLGRTRQGYGANVNFGVSQLPKAPRFLLILNDDALVQKDAVSTLRKALETHPHVAVAGAQLVDECGDPQPSWHAFPTLASELLDTLMIPAAVRQRLHKGEDRGLAGTASGIEGWPVGAALLVRADAFEQVGGFDERYFLYSEELDLAYRLRERGWGTIFCGDAVVQHVGQQSTRGRYERMLGLSRWYYIRTHWSHRDQLAFVTLLPVVYTWNALFVAVSILRRPRSFREKTEWWRGRWTRRPFPTLRDLERGRRARRSEQ